jgi:hypothetical protein
MSRAATASLLALATTALLVGCIDRDEDRTWPLDEDTGDTRTDPPDDTTGPDTSPDVLPIDTGGPDTGTNTDVDTGPDTETHTGWYQSAFETSAFTPDAKVERDGDSCRLLMSGPGTTERWWANGIGREQVHQVVGTNAGPRGWVGFVRATGEVSPKGQYGHLGAYDHQFDVSSVERMPCRTWEVMGKCVLPRAGDACYDGIRRTTEDAPDETLKRHVSGPDGGDDAPTRYTLDVEFDQRVADGGSTIHLDMTLPAKMDDGNGETRWRADEIQNLQMEKRCGWIGGIYTISYGADDVTGWVRRFDDPQTGDEAPLKLHLTTGKGTPDEPMDGAPCQPKPFKLWGHHEVDEVVGRP